MEDRNDSEPWGDPPSTPLVKDENPLLTTRVNFDVMFADGGYAIQVRYSERNGGGGNHKISSDETRKLFVVHNGQELGAKIQEILVMESLRMC